MNTPPESTNDSVLTQHGNTWASKFPPSVIILTYNEAENISACLASLSWARDVIVLDSGSTDGTLELARQIRPDVRIFYHPFHNFADQRNWALEETRPQSEWILFLDADERCTAECAEAIRTALSSSGEFAGFYLTYRNFFLGRWIKRSTLYPTWQLRLFKRGAVTFRKEGHGQREVCAGRLGYLYAPYDHHGFSKGVANWIERHNQYSSDEMELVKRLRDEALLLGDLICGRGVVRRRCLKRLGARLPGRPFLRFIYTYVFRGGFLDGRAGLVYCLLRVAHDIHVDAKLAEAELNEQRQGSS